MEVKNPPPKPTPTSLLADKAAPKPLKLCTGRDAGERSAGLHGTATPSSIQTCGDGSGIFSSSIRGRASRPALPSPRCRGYCLFQALPRISQERRRFTGTAAAASPATSKLRDGSRLTESSQRRGSRPLGRSSAQSSAAGAQLKCDRREEKGIRRKTPTPAPQTTGIKTELVKRKRKMDWGGEWEAPTKGARGGKQGRAPPTSRCGAPAGLDPAPAARVPGARFSPPKPRRGSATPPSR